MTIRFKIWNALLVGWLVTGGAINTQAKPIYVAHDTSEDNNVTTPVDAELLRPAILGEATNKVPVAVAKSSHRYGWLAETIRLSGVDSYDPDGWPVSPLTYRWNYLSGPEGLPEPTLIDISGNLMEVDLSSEVIGDFIFELTVSDGAAIDTTEIAIAFIDELSLGRRPGTNFGDFPRAEIPYAVSTIRSYTITNWGIQTLLLGEISMIEFSGPQASDFTFYADSSFSRSLQPDMETEFQVSFAPSALGTRSATLLIPYSNGINDRIFRVEFQGTRNNIYPIARPTSSSLIPMPNELVVLSAEESSDPDNSPVSPLSYHWEFKSGPVTEVMFQDVSDDHKEVSWTPTIIGEYQFELTVNDGVDSATAPIKLMVGDSLELIMPSESHEGAKPLQGKVIIPRELESDLVISIIISDESELTAPGSLIIPAGQRSVEFSIETKDDTEVDGVQNVTITASAEQWKSAEEVVSVADNEVPEIKVYQSGVLVDDRTITEVTVAESTHIDRTFVIRNEGGDQLNLTGAPLVSIIGGETENVKVIEQPRLSSIEVGEEISFVIRFMPSKDANDARAIVSIPTDAADTPDYRFELKVQTIAIYRPGGAGADHGGCGCVTGKRGSYSTEILTLLTAMMIFALVMRLKAKHSIQQD